MKKKNEEAEEENASKEIAADARSVSVLVWWCQCVAV